MLLEPGHRVGAYEIVGPLGSGGMGEVYQARDTRLGRQVAIKFISDELAADPTAAERLAREARLTSSLNHPNIVTVHDVGEMDGRPYIVMEFVTGQSLHALLASSRMKISRVVDVACQVADGLAAAHGAGVVHRDLKPRNIMVTEDGRAKIVDFGLGKTHGIASGAEDLTFQDRDRGLTGPHVVMGTAGYMAPEQVLNRPIDFRADQFALGGIIYEMVTGRRAFKRDTSVQTMAAIVDDEPEPLMELAPETPIELMTVVERCLAKNPGDRYASTQDLARDLRDVHRALAGSRASWHSGAVRPVPRRRRTRWVAAAAAALAVTAAGAYALWPSPVDRARTLLERYDKVENVDSAIALLEPFVVAAPANQEGLFSLAEAYFRKWGHSKDSRFLAKAHETARNALNLKEVNPKAHEAWLMISLREARSLLDRYDKVANVDRAIALLGPFVAANPSNQAGLVSLAEAYFHRGDRLGAPRDAALIAKALENARAALSLNERDAPTHVILAMIHNSNREYEGALSEAQRAIVLDPKNSRAWRESGRANFQLARQGGPLSGQRKSDAEKAFLNAVELGPNDWTARNSLGAFYLLEERFEEAVEQFQRMLDAAPGNVRAHNNLGSAYLLLGKFTEARGQYQISAQIDPNPTAYANLGTAYYFDHLFPEAAVEYERAIKMDDSAYRYQLYLGAARYWTSHPGAKEAYETAIRLGEEERRNTRSAPQLLADLADAHAVLGLLTTGPARLTHQGEARTFLAALERQQPKDASVRFTMASTYEELGDRAKALEWLGKAIEEKYPRKRIEATPWLENLRSDERYKLLLPK